MPLSAKTLTLLTALAAALGYGGWAIFANFEHGIKPGVIAGLVQGVYAFISTLSITHIARWVFLKFNCAWRGITVGFIASFIVMIALPLSVHNLAGTPDIWQTILPGLIWGSIYLIGFLISLDVVHRIAPAHQKNEGEK